MVDALDKLHRGLMKQRLPVRIWVMILIVTNFVVPLSLLLQAETQRIEVVVVLVVFLLSGLLMALITARSGFTRLLGAGHVLWFPLIYYLCTRLGKHPADDFFGLWIRTVITANSISLILDIIDVVRYIAGDRAETVEGL